MKMYFLILPIFMDMLILSQLLKQSVQDLKKKYFSYLK